MWCLEGVMSVLVLESGSVVSARSVEELAAEICELSGQLAAGMARLVMAIAEFDELRGVRAMGVPDGGALVGVALWCGDACGA